ncbi:MAG TPA: monovalent cation/H+ antiporter complex subunit F [Aggregatilineaceae bacterium]|nr:monovalent cation/H+ antiporter complex subunit F [Aggregatilineaceae bacterium]
MSFANPFVLTTFSALMLGFGMAFYRLLLGPSLADRVVALDLITSLAVGTIALFAIATDTEPLLDVIAVVALTSFLGTIAFAYYIEVRKT